MNPKNHQHSNLRHVLSFATLLLGSMFWVGPSFCGEQQDEMSFPKIRIERGGAPLVLKVMLTATSPGQTYPTPDGSFADEIQIRQNGTITRFRLAEIVKHIQNGASYLPKRLALSKSKPMIFEIHLGKDLLPFPLTHKRPVDWSATFDVRAVLLNSGSEQAEGSNWLTFEPERR